MFTPQQIGTNIVKKAVLHLGEKETPPGSNSGTEVNRYLAYVGLPTGNAWCAAFASFATGMTLLQMGVHANVLRTASSHEAVNWGITHKTLQTAQTAVAGDWCIEAGGDGEPAADGRSFHHTTVLVSIEGNTAKWIAGNTGDAVAYGSCDLSNCVLLRPYVLL